MARSIFSEQHLARLVAETVPPDRENAVVGTIDQTGVSVVVKMTKGKHWTVEGVFKRDWGGDVTTGTKVIWSW